MRARKIREGVHWVGAVDWDRRLFDGLVPLPNGTSYNAYVIQNGGRTVLIDTVEPDEFEVYEARLASLGVEKVDYLVANHAEQDHSGSIPRVLERFPEAKIVATPKCKQMLTDLMPVGEERFMAVEDGATLSVGDWTLEFMHAPWVHWPETMLTYLKNEKILFPCDFFGSHLATNDLYVRDEGLVLREAKRYYAQIMMPFRKMIEKHLKRLEGYEIEVIAPSHGPLFDRPALIVDAYRDWVYGECSNTVVLPYVSMHGSTKLMVDHLMEEILLRGIRVEPYNLAEADFGKLAMSMVEAATVVLGTPTVLGGPHPKAVYAAYLAGVLRPKTKFFSVVSSYGWGGRTVETIQGLISNLKAEIIEPVVVKGSPLAENLAAVEALADAIQQKHAEAGLK